MTKMTESEFQELIDLYRDRWASELERNNRLQEDRDRTELTYKDTIGLNLEVAKLAAQITSSFCRHESNQFKVVSAYQNFFEAIKDSILGVKKDDR